MHPSSETVGLLSASAEQQQKNQSLTTPGGDGLHDVVPLTLAWHNIRVSREHPAHFLILDNINGKALPREIVALMGASGAGKTTLLNALMGRNLKGLNVEGEIIVGGDRDIKIGDVSGYVQQEEMFMSTLTVYEHLMIQAGIRLAGLPKAEIKKKIVEVMDELGLTKCRNSIIGLSGVKKGISGGEAKRLMVASVLLDNPSILFLDEPTTGLDSHMAQSLMDTLRKLSKDGRTIVCTIHQPSSKIFNTLDKVIFLGDGKLAYLGPPTQVLPFFDSLGLVCPDDYNPADYIIDMLAIDRTSGNEQAALDRVHKVSHGFTQSRFTKDIYEDLQTFEGSGAKDGIINTRRRASWFSQVRLVMKRSLIDNKRNAALARAKFIQKIFMGLFVGLLYLNQTDPAPQSKEDGSEGGKGDTGINNINGAMYFIILELSLSTLFGILTFMPQDFPLIVREHFDGLYMVSAYYIARVLSYMPIFILDGMFMITISYWMIGLLPGFQFYVIILGIGILVEQCAAALGVMISTVSPSYAVAISIAGPVMTVISLTGGLFANVGALPAWFSWSQYLSWFKYGFEAMMISQWRGYETQKRANGEYYLIGDSKLEYGDLLGRYAFKEGFFWWDIGGMFAIISVCYFIGYLGLYIRVHRSR